MIAAYVVVGVLALTAVGSTVRRELSIRRRSREAKRWGDAFDREAVRRRNALPPPALRPDFRRVVPQERSCPDCGVVFERNPMVVELRCNACVTKRFEASEAEDVEDWKRKGWQ